MLHFVVARMDGSSSSVWEFGSTGSSESRQDRCEREKEREGRKDAKGESNVSFLVQVSPS